MKSSITRQLVIWLAVPLTLLALCGALVHYFNNVAPEVINGDRRLKEVAAALLAHLQLSEGGVVLDERGGAAPNLPSADSFVYAVRDGQGRLLGGDSRLPVMTVSGDANQATAITVLDHRNVRSLTTRFDTAGGGVLITVADVHSSAEPAARYGFMSTLLWDFVQLDLTLGLVWVGVALGLRPLKRLRDEIAARSPQDLRPLDEAVVPRELAPAVVTLNRLFGTLRSSARSNQQFIANTAHQLRTPITGLQAQLDLLVAEPAAQPVRERLSVLQQGIRQLAHSANQLLSLARVDPQVTVTGKAQVVQLHVTAGEVAARFFDHSLEREIDLGIDVQPAAISADPDLLDDLMSNLVDNALKYTPKGGSVTISVGQFNQRAFLAVEDTGPGIPEGERQRVKQRFYRIPNSPGHGSGLGLAIVDEVARLYGASVSIAARIQTPASGTRVEVMFPLQEPGRVPPQGVGMRKTGS